LQKEDIQGLIARGYKGLPSASFSVLTIIDATAAKGYLKEVSETITNATSAPDSSAVHLGITYAGLKYLGIKEEILSTFSREFKEGMTESHRQSILGDVEENAPSNWAWGGPENSPVHVLLLFYARDDATLEQVYKQQKAQFESSGISEVVNLPSQILPNQKEHFGFRDGISQPFVRGFSRSASLPDDQTIPAGEFILGYHNWYDQFPDSPQVSQGDDPEDILLNKDTNPEVKDLGKNGSYLVFRQLSQNVRGFWKYLKDQSIEPGSADRNEAAIKLGSKMVGRWPGGAPLVNSPDKDDPELSIDNDFLYWNEDKQGLKCPLGSHIRRTNPRDWLLTEKTDLESEEMVRKHRILRRGRPYGPPLAASMETEDLLLADEDHQKRGLHFLCFVGDIIRQFEFVQNAWVKFHKFGGLYEDSDPIIGTHYKKEGIVTDKFTVQARPVRRRYPDMPQFTRMEGGEYFFFPGIRAIKYIASV